MVVGVLLSAGHGRMVSIVFLFLCFKYPLSISIALYCRSICQNYGNFLDQEAPNHG
jgi:hypothetical protein